MLIQQVRTSLEKYSEEELRLLAAEIYKRIPKKVIAEKEIDALLEDLQAVLQTRKQSRKAANRPDFEAVAREAEKFLEDAGQQYYFAPNRVIPKSQRPKWRFIAKRLHDELLALGQDEEHLSQVSDLMTRLYELLCQACRRYLFSSDDPFRSVGIKQSQFFRDVVALQKRAGMPAEWITSAIKLIAIQGLYSSTLSEDLIDAFLEFLNTAPLKEEAVAQADRLRRKYAAQGENSRKYPDYQVQERNDTLVELVFRLHMALADHEAAVDYFKDHYVEAGLDAAYREEIKLYILLEKLLRYKQKDLWLREYEACLQRGIKPRRELVKAYEFTQKTGRLPEYIG
ncbi:MAG: hypothetical protein M1379_02700 [Firmicutes bacterium]|nr:hypothetical protein [Bacillota bacterium]